VLQRELADLPLDPCAVDRDRLLVRPEGRDDRPPDWPTTPCATLALMAVASCALGQLEGHRRLPRRGVDHQEAERSLS
jgi:hypothetical protein